MRYVRITEVLDIPEAALPKLTRAATVPFALLAASQTSVFSGAPGLKNLELLWEAPSDPALVYCPRER
jgi:hypothetical protein